MRVELHPDARGELRSAAVWYEEQREGLGAEFIAPESYPTWPNLSGRAPLIRRYILQRFPCVLAFEQYETHSLVLAIAHAKRRPLYWLARTDR